MSRMQRGFCHEEDIQNLFYVEDLIDAGNGVKYRRVGTDVEVEIRIANNNFEFGSWKEIKIADLPERI